MYSIIKVKPCDTPKSEFVIVFAMVYGDLTDTWNKNVTAVTNKMVNKVKTDKAGRVTSYKAIRGPSAKAFDIYPVNLREQFFENFVARNQKAYICPDLMDPNV